jgi:hypothetical protein
MSVSKRVDRTARAASAPSRPALQMTPAGLARTAGVGAPDAPSSARPALEV